MGKMYAVAYNLAQLFDDLVRCETRLYNALNDALRADHGIVATAYLARSARMEVRIPVDGA